MAPEKYTVEASYFGINGFELHEGDIVFDLGANCEVFTTLAGCVGSKAVAVDAQRHFLRQIGFAVWLVDNDQNVVGCIYERSGYLLAAVSNSARESLQNLEADLKAGLR